MSLRVRVPKVHIENNFLKYIARMEEYSGQYGNTSQKCVDDMGELLKRELEGLLVESELFKILAGFYGANGETEITQITKELKFEKIRRCKFVPCEQFCGSCDDCTQLIFYLDLDLKFNSSAQEFSSDFKFYYQKCIKEAYQCMGRKLDGGYAYAIYSQCENVVIDNVFCQHCQQSEKCFVRLYAGVYSGDVEKLAGRNAKRLSPHQLVELPN